MKKKKHWHYHRPLTIGNVSEKGGEGKCDRKKKQVSFEFLIYLCDEKKIALSTNTLFFSIDGAI